MEVFNKDRFIYFSVHEDGNINFNEENENVEELILPRHPETNDLDVYYLQSMLKYFDPTKDVIENEILDAFPVISLTKDKNNKFYKLSIYRLREFSKDQIKEDEYIRASVKHLYMYSQLASPSNKSLKRVIARCLRKVSPAMYRRDERDTAAGDGYQLERMASYVPTDTFSVIKLLKGWIEGALHFYDYSIMFFDRRFVGLNDFSENILDIKTKDLFYTNTWIPIYGTRLNKIDDRHLYYELNLYIHNLSRNWFFTSPNNDNERDGKVMMFRNKDVRVELEKKLTFLFRQNSFRLNDVFKWNRYIKGGKFDSHYDTMFVQRSSEECSLYTLLIYLEVEGNSFMYLSEISDEKEECVRLQGNKSYVIPHWVRHRVEGEGLREFIKAEIVFKNKDIGTSYDQALADAFDASCYYMLQSVRHPELKNVVSQNFNTINEARFYRTVFVPKLMKNIYFIKTISDIPVEYNNLVNGSLVKSRSLRFNYVTDGTYYYFKKSTNSSGLVSRNDAIVMMSLMLLDILPKKMFDRDVRACRCGHEECIDYYEKVSDIDLNEKIMYWKPDGVHRRIADVLQCAQYPSDMCEVHRVGNISVSDIRDHPQTFYFAACQNIYPCDHYKESLVSEITSLGSDGNFKSLNVEIIGEQKNIIKIRQHSFKNGIIITRKWIKEVELA